MLVQLVHVIIGKKDSATEIVSFEGTSKGAIQAEEKFLEEVNKHLDEPLSVEEKEALLEDGYFEREDAKIELHWNDVEIKEGEK